MLNPCQAPTGNPLDRGFEPSPVMNQHQQDDLSTLVWHIGDRVRIQYQQLGKQRVGQR